MRKFIILALMCLSLASCGSGNFHLMPLKRYVIPQNGMFPNLPAQSSLWVVQTPYISPAKIERGEVIVYQAAKGDEIYNLIWRVIGLPGDRVSISGTTVKINGVVLPHEQSEETDEKVVFTEKSEKSSYLVAYEKNPDPQRRPDVDIEVPEGEFFVLGDNRDNAWDSRFTGTVPFEKVVARTW
jgi:signal peptidase I